MFYKEPTAGLFLKDFEYNMVVKISKGISFDISRSLPLVTTPDSKGNWRFMGISARLKDVKKRIKKLLAVQVSPKATLADPYEKIWPVFHV